MKVLKILFFIVSFLSGGVEVVKIKRLNYYFENATFAEISDLAYDSKSSILYMVSDKGALFTFKAKFSENNFTLSPIAAYKLKTSKGKRLKRWKRDSEGLTLDSKNNLYISFEGKPKIALFRKNGIKIKNIKLPKVLKKAKLRSRNKSLESLIWHPKYGLLTALEYPDKKSDMLEQTIYSTDGKMWHFKMENISNNAITALEVTDDGNLLILERAYNGIFGKFQVNLVKMLLKSCKQGTFCKTQKILTIDSAKGWEVQNFEGITKVGKGRYIIISDDNNSPFADTVLVYLKGIK